MITDLVKVIGHPFSEVAVRETAYVPAEAYLCFGFWAVATRLSPKSHLYDDMEPVVIAEEFVKAIESFTQVPEVLNATTGSGCTVTVFVMEPIHPFDEVTTSFTGYEPAAV